MAATAYPSVFMSALALICRLLAHMQTLSQLAPPPNWRHRPIDATAQLAPLSAKALRPAPIGATPSADWRHRGQLGAICGGFRS